jgi:hypothetical protein
MDDVERLTLELFTNRNQYKKYLAKNEPEKYIKLEEEREKLLQHKDAILLKTEQLISIPDLEVSPLVRESFQRFVNTLIREIETDALLPQEYNEYDDEEDEDTTIFTNMEDSSAKKSFWSGDRVLKQNDIFDHYPTNNLVRKRFVGRKPV